MNKLLTKIAKVVLGLSLAAGVGVAVGTKKVVHKADAAGKDDWVQVTALSGLNTTDTYVIANNADKGYYLNGSLNSGHFQSTAFGSSAPASATAAGAFKLEAVNAGNNIYKMKLVSTSKYMTATKAGSGGGSVTATSDSTGWKFLLSGTSFNAIYQTAYSGKYAALRCYNNTSWRTYQNNSATSVSTTSGTVFRLYKYQQTSGTPTVNGVSLSQSTMVLDLNGTSSRALTANVDVSYGAAETVTWSVQSSNPSNCVSVNSSGTVSASSTGTATIRATSTVDNTKYADCVVTIIDTTAPAGSTTVTTNIGTYASANSWTNDTRFTSVNMDANITANAEYASGSNTGKYYTTNNSWRFYGNETGTLVIEAASGFLLHSVKVTYTEASQGVLFDENSNHLNSPASALCGGSSSYTFSLGTVGNIQVTSITVVYYPDPSAQSYTISFNGNGALGSIASINDYLGNYTLPDSTGFTTPTGKIFAGWKANNTGTLLEVGDTYNVTANVEFYAQWVNAYSVTFTAGDHGTGSYQITVAEGTYALPAYSEISGSGKVNASSGYKFDNYTISGTDYDPADTITISAATSVTVNFAEQSNEDIIVVADTDATSTTYVLTTGITKDAAVYASQNGKADASNGGGLQYRSNNNNSGIVSTTSGGLIRKVTITYADGKSGQMDIYGKNVAYTNPTDLYSDSLKGTFLGSISSTGSISIEDDYQYVGVRSSSGARYLLSIAFEWENYDPTAPSISIDQAGSEQEIGATGTLTATIANAGDNTVSWSSSDPSVISIDSSSGAWSAIKMGAVEITATLGSTGKKSTIDMSVTGNVNVARARDIIDTLEGADSPYRVTISGYVISASGDGTSSKNNSITIADAADGTDLLQIFIGYKAVSNWSDVSTVGAKIKAKGTLLKYNSTYELKNPVDIEVVDSDRAAVEEFVNDYMHMDYTSNLGYCSDQAHGYYLAAKAAFNDLTAAQQLLFKTDSEFSAEKARFEAWAVANRDADPYDGYDDIHTPLSVKVVEAVVGAKTNTITVIIIVSLVSITAIGGYFYIRRRKEI